MGEEYDKSIAPKSLALFPIRSADVGPLFAPDGFTRRLTSILECHEYRTHLLDRVDKCLLES